MNFRISQQGFTLAEIIIAVAISLIALIAVASAFIVQNQHFAQQMRIVEMEQNVRAALQIMVRELLQAGYIKDPTTPPNQDVTGEPFADGVAEDIEEADTATLTFQADIDGDGNTETVRYAWSGTAGDPLTREEWEWNSGDETLAENVENLSFSYFRFDEDTPMSAPLSTATDRADVRRIGIGLTVRSESNEPEMMTLRSSVTPRNLAVGP